MKNYLLLLFTFCSYMVMGQISISTFETWNNVYQPQESFNNTSSMIAFGTPSVDASSANAWHRSDNTTDWVDPTQGNPPATAHQGSYYA